MGSKYREKQKRKQQGHKDWPAMKGQIPRIAGQYGRYVKLEKSGKVIRVGNPNSKRKSKDETVESQQSN